jgi:hypothetical protein
LKENLYENTPETRSNAKKTEKIFLKRQKITDCLDSAGYQNPEKRHGPEDLRLSL